MGRQIHENNVRRVKNPSPGAGPWRTTCELRSGPQYPPFPAPFSMVPGRCFGRLIRRSTPKWKCSFSPFGRALLLLKPTVWCSAPKLRFLPFQKTKFVIVPPRLFFIQFFASHFTRLLHRFWLDLVSFFTLVPYFFVIDFGTNFRIPFVWLCGQHVLREMVPDRIYFLIFPHGLLFIFFPQFWLPLWHPFGLSGVPFGIETTSSDENRTLSEHDRGHRTIMGNI